MEDIRAVVNKQEYKREFIYDNTVVLNTAFESIIVDIEKFRFAENRINGTIDRQLQLFLRDNEFSLFPEAVRVYKEAVNNGFPVRAFESLLTYTVTCNQNGLLSLYRDRYDYTGGAHGSTVRRSDTFNLRTGGTLPVSAFFPPRFDYEKYLIEEMIKLAGQNPDIYFENYAELIKKNFNPQNFYITENGITIYYQQYEVAPYSSGIIEFNISLKNF